MSEWTGYSFKRMEEIRQYERISNAPKRIRGEAFGMDLTVGSSEPHADTRETCPVCGLKAVLTVYEGERICQSCLEGLAEGGAGESFLGGQWELLSCYGVCATYATEAEAQEAVVYAASRGVERTYRRAQ